MMFTQVLYDERGISKIACLVVTDGNEFREESKVWQIMSIASMQCMSIASPIVKINLGMPYSLIKDMI